MENLRSPQNELLPFLSYGSFNPRQLRYNLISDYVLDHKLVEITGLIKEKDGIPVFYLPTPNLKNNVYQAYKIYFKKGREKEAYEIIAKNEPNTFYDWNELSDQNILVARKQLRGLTYFDDYTWSFKDDPYFINGLYACEQIFSEPINENNNKYLDFFRAQAAYICCGQ